MNYLRTSILLAAMTGLFLAIGFMFGGEVGMAIPFIIALGMNAFAYWNADKMALRMYGAREVDEQSAPVLPPPCGPTRRPGRHADAQGLCHRK